MFRNITILAILFLSVLWLPFGAQVVIFLISLFLIPHVWLLVLPAIFADVLYSTNLYSIDGIKNTLFAIVIILIYKIILSKIRL